MFDARAALEVLASECGGAQVWDCGAGRVRVRGAGRGLYTAEYSGAMSARCFAALRGHVVAATLEATVLLLDMCKVLDMQLEPPPVLSGTYPACTAPGVVLCRPEQYAMWSAYAAKLAERGVTRIVFYDSERALALSVVDALAQH